MEHVTNMLTNPVVTQTTGTTGPAFFGNFIPNAIGLILSIGLLFFFGMLVLGIIKWIGSGGDKQSLEEAKSKMTNAVIGLVVMLCIYLILNFLGTFFGITILTIDLSTFVVQ